MSFSNTPISYLDEDKYDAERTIALKYIKEREERAMTVQNILAPITPQDEFIFDVARGENDSDVSELSDPFQELGGNIIMSMENKQKRRLSKVEADILVMNSFPKKHMEIQNELAADLNQYRAPHLDFDKIMEDKKKYGESDEDDEILQSVAANLEQCGLKVHLEEKRKREEREKLRMKPKPKKVKTSDEPHFETNSLSGIWRMLDAASVDNDDFPITQQGYNFYEDKKTWVNPNEKSWNQKEEIRKKCEDWLKNVKQ
ncbi:hypothetical protein PVAND_000421 [Polypedilum vanderplanki]|uniref:Uncharacterized protein n=1 Tax=Polypedilum vanderplanki TaxID=319348 RepID=A0A9J6BKW2_POLVA|nr:hypothetical protein PVAND_000421 [Polypedilum vanderplanki]